MSSTLWKYLDTVDGCTPNRCAKSSSNKLRRSFIKNINTIDSFGTLVWSGKCGDKSENKALNRIHSGNPVTTNYQYKLAKTNQLNSSNSILYVPV